MILWSASYSFFNFYQEWRLMKSMSRSKFKYASPGVIVVVGLAIGLVISSLFSGSAFANPVQPHFNRFLSTHAGDDDSYDDNNPDNPGNGDGGLNGANQEAHGNWLVPRRIQRFLRLVILVVRRRTLGA
jgi:hypothetical protein